MNHEPHLTGRKTPSAALGALAWLARAGTAAALAAGMLAAQAQTNSPTPPVRPRAVPPMLRVPAARIPVEIARVRIDAQVVGLAAQTRIELELRNPNEQMLEGELQFPLQPGQVVTGFALDFDSELRPAVPVDKAKGRQVFEDVTRTRVDPALLEATGGNNYKLRIYPLPPRGTRRVVLELSETLARTGAGERAEASYVVPLNFGAVVRRLDVSVQLPPKAHAKASFAALGPQQLTVQRGPDGSQVASVSRTDFRGRDTLRLAIRQDPGVPQVSTQVFKDANYFYAEVPAALKVQARPDPGIVAVVWDASGSGAARDHGRELALLDSYFKALRNVTVELVVVRDAADAPRRFTVAGGDWSALREHLRGLAYDGATRAEHMQVPASAELALLFSDGLATYGERGVPASRVPLYAVTSSVSADPVRLRHAAEQSGGMLLDLVQRQPAEAVRELRLQRTRLTGLQATGATELVAETLHPQHGRLVIAGRLTDPRAEISLELQAPDGTRSTRRLSVAGDSGSRRQARLPIAAHRWAALKLATLEADPAQNQQAIRRLGTQFGIVTSGTSLIVLDAVSDYVRHEIEPPASLRDTWGYLMALRKGRENTARASQLERVAQSFAARQSWWDKDFPKGERPAPPKPSQAEEAQRQAEADRRASESVGRTAPRMMAPAPMPAPMPAPAPSPPPTGSSAPRMAAAPAAAAPSAPTEAAIALKKWAPDSPYARRLRAAAPDGMYEVYLDERPAYTSSTAFYLDAADIFQERNQPLLAQRILSNLAEMDLENRQILRILAYRLLQAGEVKLALPLLKKVLVLSPDEPQSYRDYGLALARDGQHQAAIEQLWQVVSRPWNNRFPDIEQVALAELNAIRAQAAAAGVTLDTSAVDSRLLRNLPLDLRAVLSWDADNTDIDLYVQDPNGELAHYGHQLTYQGGHMSPDFTGGFGPEEFALRLAKPGTYTVKAEFYGHRQQIVAPATTLMLRLTTGFGTPQQKDSDVVVRLSGEKQVVTIGTFEVKPAAAAPGNAAAAAP